MSHRYSSRMRRGGWSRGGSSKKEEPMSGAGYDIEKTLMEEDERWKKLEHAVALAVNYYQMRPIDHDYRFDATEIIKDRAMSNYARITGGEDDYSIVMLIRALPRTDIDACVQPPSQKMMMPFPLRMDSHDTFLSDDAFGPQDEEVDDAAATAAAAEA